MNDMKILNQRGFCDSIQCSTFCRRYKTHFCFSSVSAEADFILLMTYEGENWEKNNIWSSYVC